MTVETIHAGRPLKVFVSYSHKDESLCRELQASLQLLVRQGLIHPWHDRMIAAGTEWKDEISIHLENADIILLLISSDFLASDYCYDIEMTRALVRHQNHEARVIPVILRDCDWQSAPFGILQELPTDGRPVVGHHFRSKDEALRVIATGIRAVAEEIIGQVPSPRNWNAIATVGERNKDVLATSNQGNLPVQLTTFVGRAYECADIQRMLLAARILTVTGAAGIGKTRLALQVAGDYAHISGGNSWFVDLSTVIDPNDVPHAVASALGLHENVHKTLVCQIIERCLPVGTLLMLDNCDLMVAACAALSSTLLRSCPSLKIMATSQRPLHVPGEILFNVPVLTLPKSNTEFSIEEIESTDAVQLFLDRARYSLPGFSVNVTNAAAIVEVCTRLDGIPLAIELAAARLRMLSVQDLASHLGHRFTLLTGGSSTEIPQHLTLRALIDWSYGLLSEREQHLFCRLSVFASGWTLDSAEEICSADGIDRGEVMETLVSLVEKSLVMYGEETSQSRYRYLETIREYAKEKLGEAGSDGRLRHRYCSYFLSFAEASAQGLQGADQAAWLERTDLEYENLVSAVRWCIRDESICELGQRMAVALYWYWAITGKTREGRTVSEALETRIGPALETASRADLLNCLGNMSQDQGDFEAALNYYEAGRQMSERLGYQEGVASALCRMGNALSEQGNSSAGRIKCEEGLSIYEKLGDLQGICLGLFYLGNSLIDSGDLQKATLVFERNLTVARTLGDDRRTGIIYCCLADICRQTENVDEASRYFAKNLQILKRMPSTQGIIYSLEGVAELVASRGNPSRGACLLAAAATLRERSNFPVSKNGEERYHNVIQFIQRQLSSEAYATNWGLGKHLTAMEAVDCALESL